MPTLASLVRRDVPLVTGAAAVYAHKAALTRDYRFMSRFGDEVLLHRVSSDGKLVYLPRALCPIGKTDARVSGVPVIFPGRPTPRPRQGEFFQEIRGFLKNGQSGIATAGTGFGKTPAGCDAIAEVGVKSLVIVTKDDIYKQWITAGQEFLGLQPHEIGEIRGDKCQVLGTKLVVAMIHSLARPGVYPEWVDDEFGLIIWDECHRVAAEQFSNTAWMFRAKLRLGLSATPHRQDGKELLLFAHLGPIRAQAEVELMVPRVLRKVTAWQCPMVFRMNKKTGEKQVVKLPHTQAKTTHIEKMMAADDDRNHMIADDLYEAFKKGRKTVLFSTLHSHLETFHRALVRRGVSAREIGYYVGATTKKDREIRDRISGRPILLTTFGMMGEGTDLPWLDTCVLAIPRAHVTQPAGRIRREYEGKQPPVIIDYVDLDSPVFAGYADSRLRWYRSIGAEVLDVE